MASNFNKSPTQTRLSDYKPKFLHKSICYLLLLGTLSLTFSYFSTNRKINHCHSTYRKKILCTNDARSKLLPTQEAFLLTPKILPPNCYFSTDSNIRASQSGINFKSNKRILCAFILKLLVGRAVLPTTTRSPPCCNPNEEDILPFFRSRPQITTEDVRREANRVRSHNYN